MPTYFRIQFGSRSAPIGSNLFVVGMWILLFLFFPLAAFATGNGKISGTKFSDDNNNGVRDGLEAGVPGWTITLAGPTGNLSATTGGGGGYQFDSLVAGSYTVGEVQQPGWVQTFPVSPNTHPVNLATDQSVVTGIDFGNKPPVFGSISGKKFNAVINLDCVQDGGETGLAGWTIKLNPGQLTALTNGNGDYSFGSLAPGNYTVSEVLPPGWERVCPAGNYTIALGQGEVVTDKNFANRLVPGTITGTKFNDANANCVRDGGENGLSGWTIMVNPGGFSATTDSSGNYTIASLTPGTYIVSEVLQTDWVQTCPVGGTYNIDLNQQPAFSGLNFGNRFAPLPPLGTISGEKFQDANSNCVKDSGFGEAGLEGWTIYLDRAGFPTVTTLTNVAGRYSFGSLDPGTYTVSEELQPGWEQTCPLAGTYEVILGQGEMVGSRNFGNRRVVGLPDLTVSVAGGPARPSSKKTYGIYYKYSGTGSTTDPVIVTLTIPPAPLVSWFANSSPGIYDNGNRTVTWDLGILASGAEGWLTAIVDIADVGTVPLGTELTSSVQIVPGNQMDTETQKVRGSFDPNEKLVSPQGEGAFGGITRNQLLAYQVNFQNTGTDTAFIVVLRDTLDVNLDIATVQSGASSHPYTFTTAGREMTWTFTNINLPDSVVNEPGSHGFVRYKVKPKSNAVIGADITNRAGIFFDFNPSVITNTVSNRITCAGAKGDMNGDAVLTSSDVVLELNCTFLGAGNCDPCFADLNCDGNLTSSDVVLELNDVFLGIPPTGCP